MAGESGAPEGRAGEASGSGDIMPSPSAPAHQAMPVRRVEQGTVSGPEMWAPASELSKEHDEGQGGDMVPSATKKKLKLKRRRQPSSEAPGSKVRRKAKTHALRTELIG